MAEIILRDYEDEYGNLNVIGNGNLSSSVVVPQIEAAKGSPLTVKIASVGGSVFNGLAIYNALISHGDVTTINEGYAMSIAALIAMAGKTRQTYSSSMFMVHKASAFAFGGMNADDMRREAAALDVADSIMVDVFGQVTGIASNKMESLLSDETFYTGYDSHKLGFFNELINGDTQAIAKTSYDRITANQPYKMVALMDKTLKIKENTDMSTNAELLTEIKAQREENQTFWAGIKSALGFKAEAEVLEPVAEVVVEDKPDLEAENAELKAKVAELENAKLEADSVLIEATNALKEFKAQSAAFKTELEATRSGYQAKGKGEDFVKSVEAKDAEAKFVKPTKK